MALKELTRAETQSVCEPEASGEIPKLVCFVCTGNTCRSPMAEAVLRHFGGGRYMAVSAGLSAVEGESISENAVAALRGSGIKETAENPYSSHRARNMTRELAARSDIIVAISASHLLRLTVAFPEFAEKMRVMPQDIPDPFLGSLATYEKCLRAIVSGVSDMFALGVCETYSVRPGVPEDVPRIFEIVTEAFTDAWTEEMIRSCFEPYTDVWVLESSVHGICGFAVLDRKLAGEAELHNIALSREARGRGLAGLLMDRLIGRARERGVRRIMLEVRESNAPAIALYRSYGFEKVGMRPAYYRSPTENAWLMDLILDGGDGTRRLRT